MPRPAPRVAPATKAILPCNTFFGAFSGFFFGPTAISNHLRAYTVALLMSSLRRIVNPPPTPPIQPRAWVGKNGGRHGDTSNQRSKQNPPCDAGRREQTCHLRFPVRQPVHERGTSVPSHPTTTPRVGRKTPSVAPLLQPML